MKEDGGLLRLASKMVFAQQSNTEAQIVKLEQKDPTQERSRKIRILTTRVRAWDLLSELIRKELLP